MVLRRVEVGHPSFEECELQILHLEPVYDLRVKIEAEGVDDLLYVVHCLLRIPTCVDVKQEWTQPELFFGDIGEVRTVDAAADAEDTVVRTSGTATFDDLSLSQQHLLAATVGDPVGQYVGVEIVAVIAPAARIEGYR